MEFEDMSVPFTVECSPAERRQEHADVLREAAKDDQAAAEWEATL